MVCHALVFSPRASSRGNVSLLTSADHEEHLRRAPGAGRRRRRGPLLGPGPSQAEARLQPGDLYPPSAGRNIFFCPPRWSLPDLFRQTSGCLKPRGKIS